jgi:Ankyrin repeats (3 copies)/Ankyrin repeats (many copies)
VDSLLDKINIKKVKHALQKFSKGFKSSQGPRNLDEAYQEAYDEAYAEAIKRIDSQLLGKAEVAKRAISWITYAGRPLKSQELCHALAVELGEEELDPENIDDVGDIVSFCAGLVTVDEESNIIRLVHYTTQEYFERIRETWIPNAQQEITSACLTYLSFSTFRSGSCSSDEGLNGRLEQYVFLDYAARYWGHHTRTVQEKVYKLASSFLQNGNFVSCALQTMSMSEDRGGRYSQSFPKQATGLHLTARFGLFYLLEKLLAERDDVEVDSKDDSGQTPLSWAAVSGREAVVKLLLETGKVDVDSKDTAGQTPLSWAAGSGHEAVVKLLLETGKVDVDSKDKYGRTPLSQAATNGYEAVVKLLLETGKVDIESKDTEYGQTPLSRAAESGNEAVVKPARDG